MSRDGEHRDVVNHGDSLSSLPIHLKNYRNASLNKKEAEVEKLNQNPFQIVKRDSENSYSWSQLADYEYYAYGGGGDDLSGGFHQK